MIATLGCGQKLGTALLAYTPLVSVFNNGWRGLCIRNRWPPLPYKQIVETMLALKIIAFLAAFAAVCLLALHQFITWMKEMRSTKTMIGTFPLIAD
jgi:hypothetical protein